jgi:tetratricopeptide (TPR) repeat protein
MAYGTTGAPALRALSGRTSPSVVSFIGYDAAYRTLAEGAGFFIGEGRIVASRHILQGARAARVMRADGTVHDVLGVLAEDPAADLVLAAVDIPDRTVPALPLSKTLPAPGERVAVLGGRLSVEREGLEGVVTSVREAPFLGTVFLVTCPSAKGGSGSPVIGMDGEVFGISLARPVEGGLLQCVIPAARIEAMQATAFQKVSERPMTEVDADPARFLPGVRCLLAEDVEGALARFRAVADEDPADAAAWKAVADAQVALGRGKEAVEAARAAVNLDPEDADNLETLGAACIEAEMFPEAAEACRQVTRIRPKDPRAWNRYGVACYDGGRNEEAAAALREAIRLRPDDARSHKNLGVALLALGRFDGAVDAFREAVHLKPDFERAWKDLALVHFRLGALEKAADENLEALRIRPEYARAHNNLGVVYQSLGRTEEAVQSYKEALRLRPRFGQAWANLAYAYLKLGRHDEATRAYEESVAREPGNAEARTSLAVLYRRAGKKEDARRELVEALRAEPGCARAHYHLGRFHLAQGDRAAALEEYRLLLTIDEKRANRLFDSVYK